MNQPINRVVTSGTFSLDGGTWDVDNNVWLVGDENEVLVIDAAHDLEKIALGIGGRRVVAVVCTDAHNDHVNRAPALSDRFKGAGGIELRALVTPGHQSPARRASTRRNL